MGRVYTFGAYIQKYFKRSLYNMSGKNASRIEDLYRWIAHDFTLTTIFDVKQMQKVNVLSTIAPMQGVY